MVVQLADQHFERVYINKVRKTKIAQLQKCVKTFTETTDQTVKTKVVEELRSLALSEHGLMSTDLRKSCWPLLLNIESVFSKECKSLNQPPFKVPFSQSIRWKQHIKEYPDRHQVEVDVKRTLHSFDVCKKMTEESRQSKRDELQDLLDAVLVKTETVNKQKLNYYQGMNDIGATMLLTLDQNLAYYATDVFSRFYL